MLAIACPQVAMRPEDSSALRERGQGYPWGDRVPKRIRLLTAVRADLPGPRHSPEIASAGQIYDAFCNRYGAVSAILADGSLLGVKPDEFEIVAWHGEAVAPSTTECLRVFSSGQRVRVAVGPLIGRIGTVARLRRADQAAWVDFEDLPSEHISFADDPNRRGHALVWPEDCTAFP